MEKLRLVEGELADQGKALAYNILNSQSSPKPIKAAATGTLKSQDKKCFTIRTRPVLRMTAACFTSLSKPFLIGNFTVSLPTGHLLNEIFTATEEHSAFFCHKSLDVSLSPCTAYIDLRLIKKVR